jgi:hypothetical protein
VFKNFINLIYSILLYFYLFKTRRISCCLSQRNCKMSRNFIQINISFFLRFRTFIFIIFVGCTVWYKSHAKKLMTTIVRKLNALHDADIASQCNKVESRSLEDLQRDH